jgi:hypothetical protein
MRARYTRGTPDLFKAPYPCSSRSPLPARSSCVSERRSVLNDLKERLTAEEQKLTESRFRTMQWCEENLQVAVRLFHRNHQVEMYSPVTVRLFHRSRQVGNL